MDSNRPKSMKMIIRTMLPAVIAAYLGTALGFIVRDLVTFASVEAQTNPAYWLFLLGVPMLGAGIYVAFFRIMAKLSLQKLSRYDVLYAASLTIAFLGLFLILNGLVVV